MSLLRRLSDSLWSYVSPRKTTNAPRPAPKTEPTFKKPAMPARRPSMRELKRKARSMSPGERIGTWRVQSPESPASPSAAGGKRKRPYTPSSSGAGRRSKTPRRSDTPAMQDCDGDTVMGDEERSRNGSIPYQPRFTGVGIRSSSEARSMHEYSPEVDGMSVDHTLIVSDEAHSPPSRRKVVSLPEEHSMRHISAEELRAQGWDDDYITLIQRIAMRGFEPLLPSYMKFEYSFLPDGLFEDGDDAFLASVRHEHFKAGKALEQLLELGGRVRDRDYMQGPIEPEEQVRRQLNTYVKWAFDDAGIDRHTAIPILTTEFQPAGTEAGTLRANATKKCRRLAARYREALRVQRSVEISPPGSRSSNNTMLSYPVPTLYAIIASHAIVALMAYNPEAPEPECTPMAFFDLKDKNYDVWNSLALAIIVCHVRNVHLRIAEETGFGQKQPELEEEMEEEDPDA